VFCVEALREALISGLSEIFNTDQGCQFTSVLSPGCSRRTEVRISIDARGRVFDNIFVERLWRTVKYEDIRDYGSVAELDAGLARYFRFYNEERPHQSLDYRTPAAGGLTVMEDMQLHDLFGGRNRTYDQRIKRK
jgi:putative transposase